jgi:hypothetical protein
MDFDFDRTLRRRQPTAARDGGVVEWPSSYDRPLLRLYVTGNTLVYRDIKQIPHRYANIDLALLHLGGARALSVLVTMDAKQGVEIIKTINLTVAIPVHYNDYDVMKLSLDDLQREVAAAGLEDHMRYLLHGDTYTFGVPPIGGCNAPTPRLPPGLLAGNLLPALGTASEHGCRYGDEKNDVYNTERGGCGDAKQRGGTWIGGRAGGRRSDDGGGKGGAGVHAPA